MNTVYTEMKIYINTKYSQSQGIRKNTSQRDRRTQTDVTDSNIMGITSSLWRGWLWNLPPAKNATKWPKRGSRSFKATGFDTDRKPGCDFVFVIRTNLYPILQRFRDIAIKLARRTKGDRTEERREAHTLQFNRLLGTHCQYKHVTALLMAGDCPLPLVQHGFVISDGNADATSHGQEIYYRCEMGYVNGTDVPRCDNGTWTADALCKPGIYIYMTAADYLLL